MKKYFHLFLLFLCCGLLIYTCKPVKKTKKPSGRPHTKVKPKTVVDTSTVIKEVIIPSIKIALLQPFKLDSISAYSPDKTIDEIVPEISQKALQFYEGTLMAIDSLKSMKSRFEFFVYDIPNDTSRIKEFLEEENLSSMDLIIGPPSNTQLRILADFAKKRKVYLLSPFSPSITVTYSNPYYIMLNPSIKAHCEAIFKYIKEDYSRKKVIMFHQNNVTENNMAFNFKFLAKKDSFLKTITEIVYQVDDKKKLDNTVLTPGVKNMIIIPSFEEEFVEIMLSQLKKLVPAYNIEVYGMPAWNEMESLRGESLQKVNAHITNSFWLNKNNSDIALFEKNYFKRYKTLPIDYSYMGYDATLYFGKLLNMYGKDFGVYLTKNKNTTLVNPFNFEQSLVKYQLQTTPVTTPRGKPASNPPPTFDFYENKYLNILKYENYSLKKMN